MDALTQLFSTFNVKANIFHNGQYCGRWAVDTSGSGFITFHVIAHGQCLLKVSDGDSAISLNKGDMVLFPRDVTHCLTTDDTFETAKNQATSRGWTDGEQADSTGLVCGIFEHHHPLVEHFIRELPEYVVIRSNDESTLITRLMETLIDESKKGMQGVDYIINHLADCILAVLLREHLSVDKGMLAGLLHPKLGLALQAIHEKPVAKWTIETLAAICHLSKAQFAAQFKQTLGLTPMEYVTQWVFSNAYLALEAQESTLAVALTCGYDNESSFSKAFKRVMKVSPGAVRKAGSEAASVS